MAVYTGTAANNTYTGTGSADTIAGRAGNDKLYGGNGNDRILGEDGNDSLFGGNDADLLFGGNGNDSLDGGVGNDSLDGGNGNDSLGGGSGTDTVFASLGNDRIDGGTGNDSLAGGDGNDTVVGATGNDVIDGGTGNDSLGGGAGADTVTDATGNDVIDGGSGNDSLSGGDGTDTVAGGTGNDVIDGGSGNDSIAGGDGADTVTGATGNDTIDGGTGTDTVVFAGNISQYQITGIAGGVVRFIDLAPLDGDDGTDLVSNAETIVFANRTVTFASLLNTAPVAGDDTIGVNEDGPAATGSLFDNDSDLDGNTLTVAAVNGLPGNVGSTIVLASGARLLVGPNGSYRFDPNGGYESLGQGQDATYRFTYTLSDGRGGSDGASVTVTIAGANDAPDAVDDAITIDEDEVASGSLLGNDDDPDAGDSLTVTAVDGSDSVVGSAIELASGALLTVNADGSYSYDTNEAFEGLGVGDTDSDSFTYTVSDGNGGSDTATVEVTITGANDVPDAVDDTIEVDAGDSGSSILAAVPPGLGDSLLDNDEDPDGDTLTVTAIDDDDAAVGAPVTLASGALLTVNADGSYGYDTNGAYDYLGEGETAEDSFTYTVSDGNGGTDTATVDVTITGVNDAPTADDAHLDVYEADGEYSGNLLDYATDPDLNDILFISAIDGSDAFGEGAIQLDDSFAWLTVTADGAFTIDPPNAPNDGETREDSFTYTVSDGNGGFATATISFTVYGAGTEV